ncbi:MAG: hypothetical protein ACKOC7_03430 [Sphingomonadales bacterium]
MAALAILGTVSARAGGSNVFKAVLRIVLGGTIAMVISAVVGYFFGVRV